MAQRHSLLINQLSPVCSCSTIYKPANPAMLEKQNCTEVSFPRPMSDGKFEIF